MTGNFSLVNGRRTCGKNNSDDGHVVVREHETDSVEVIIWVDEDIDDHSDVEYHYAIFYVERNLLEPNEGLCAYRGI